MLKANSSEESLKETPQPILVYCAKLKSYQTLLKMQFLIAFRVCTE